MKYLFALLFFIFCLPLLAQEHAFSIRNSMSSEKLRPRNVHVVKDSITQNTAVFMVASNAIYGMLYDDSLILQKKIKANPLPSQFKNFQGVTINDNTYNFLLSNQSNKKFGVVLFDFDNRTSSSYKLDFKFKKESFLSVVSHEEQCYILTVSKKNSEINAYSFSDDWNSPKKTRFVFNEVADGEFSFNKIFASFPVIKIQSDEPISLDVASSRIKLYQENTAITLISNREKYVTKVLSFNLETKEQSEHVFDIPALTERKYFPRGNSFKLGDKLFQMATNSLALTYDITSLTTNEVLNTYSFSSEDTIDFKNGDFFKKSASDKTTIENTKAFLRKVMHTNVGITAYKKGSDYIVSVGGVEEAPNVTSIYAGGAVGGLVGGLIMAYLNNQGSKSFGFNSILNKDLAHIQGTVEMNKFDLINSFAKSKKVVGESLFKHKGSYYWGNYSFKNDLYNFYKFN